MEKAIALFVRLISIGLFIAVGLMVSFSAIAKELENKAYWICKNKREVRTVRVFVNDQGICSTLYSKAGSEKSVGSGKSLESCKGFLANIKTNLEKSDWTCRDISETQITSATEP